MHSASSHWCIIRSPRGGVYPTQPGAMLRADKTQVARSDRGSAWQGGGRAGEMQQRQGEEMDFTALNEPESSIKAPSRPCACSRNMLSE